MLFFNDSLSLEAWEKKSSGLAKDGEAEFNLIRPHRQFRYPPFPELKTTNEEQVKELIWLHQNSQVHLAPNLWTALQSIVEGLRATGKTIRKIALQGPPVPWEFSFALGQLNCETVLLPRDPVEFKKADLSKIDLLTFSNPSRVDGFFYPQELYVSLLRHFFQQSPGAFAVSEESLSLFSFNEVPPGTFTELARAQQSRVIYLSSLEPAMSPLGPKVSWYYGSAELPKIKFEISTDDLLQTARALTAFQSRQGGAVMEFNRRMLAMRVGLRLFTDAFKSNLQRGEISVPFWPETGFHLLIDIAPQLKDLSLREWCLWLSREKGVLVGPGDLFGLKTSIQVCFAAPHSYLQRASKALAQALDLSAT